MNTDLYKLAQENNIDVISTELPTTESCSVRVDGKYYIGMDSALYGPEERIHLAHELGHCLSGAMYNVYAPLDNRAKHELRAEQWSLRRLIPRDILTDKLAQGYNAWDIADMLNVPVRYVSKAYDMYRRSDNHAAI